MNNDALELYSQEEIKTDIMRYKTNGLSFWLCMLSIVLNVAMFLIIYTKSSCTPNFELGLDLLVNVIFMLAAFLTAEKTKAYNKRAGFVAMGIGTIQIARIFWIPLKYFNLWIKWSQDVEVIKQNLLSQGVSPEQMAPYLPVMNGLSNVQFIWCAVLLALSCLSLITAGIVAVIKGNKLNAHLAKLQERG